MTSADMEKGFSCFSMNVIFMTWTSSVVSVSLDDILSGVAFELLSEGL
jgi:hypothetical protein